MRYDLQLFIIKSGGILREFFYFSVKINGLMISVNPFLITLSLFQAVEICISIQVFTKVLPALCLFLLEHAFCLSRNIYASKEIFQIQCRFQLAECKFSLFAASVHSLSHLSGDDLQKSLIFLLKTPFADCDKIFVTLIKISFAHSCVVELGKYQKQKVILEKMKICRIFFAHNITIKLFQKNYYA